MKLRNVLFAMIFLHGHLSAGILDVFSHLTDTRNILTLRKITVINHTDKPVWIGVYRLSANIWGQSYGDAALQGPVVLIPKDGQVDLDRSDFKIKTNRELIFSDEEHLLKPQLNPNEYGLASKTPVSVKYGSVFHIAEKHDVLHGYSDAEWKISEPAIAAARIMFDRMLERLRKSFYRPPYGDKKATVRSGSELDTQETAFLKKRMVKVKKALEHFLCVDLKDNEVPRIAICTSGGGMRAAIATLGLLEGLDAIGLLNGLVYAAGLSGSTWTLASFVELRLPMDEYAQHFTQVLAKKHVFTPYDLAHILWTKYAFNQYTNIVDLYGVFLANSFFHNNDKPEEERYRRLDIHLSDSQRHLVGGDTFFPLYTAVQAKGSDLHWATFTPYEFSIDDFAMAIPIWALGREFKEGVSTNFAPEQSLGFLMGIWGSALSGSVLDMLNTQKTSLPALAFKAMESTFFETGIADIEFAGIRLANPFYGIKSPFIRNLGELKLIDGGYSFNLPFPPLLKKEREVDVIIVLDAGADAHNNAPAFKKAIDYAEARGIGFEKIDYAELVNKQINVIKGKGPKIPTILFMVPVKNERYNSNFDPKIEFGTTYNTMNLFYDPEDVEKLSGLVRQNIIDNKDLIVKTIKDKIESKRKKKIE